MAILSNKYSSIDKKTLHQLRTPPTEVFSLEKDPDLYLLFKLFLSSLKTSAKFYAKNWAAILRQHPDDKILLYNQMKNILARVTGIGSMIHLMCINSCMAFTGPFLQLDRCLKCKEPKPCSITKRLQQEFYTILIRPLLQVLWHNPSSAWRFSYWWEKTLQILAELCKNQSNLSGYDNFFHSSSYLENIRNGNIQDDNMILMFFIDGT